MLVPEYGDHEFQWLKKFGPVYRLKGCFGQDRLVVADPLALHHILGSPMFGWVGMMYVLVDLMWGVQSVMGASGRQLLQCRQIIAQLSLSRLSAQSAKDLSEEFVANNAQLVINTGGPPLWHLPYWHSPNIRPFKPSGLFIRALDIKTLKSSFCSSPFTLTRFSSPALLCPVFFSLTLGGFGSPSSDPWLPLNTGSACSVFRLPPMCFPADIPLRCKAPQPERPIPLQTTHTPLSPLVGVADTQHTVLLFLLPSPPSSYAILEDVTTLPYNNIPLLNALIKDTVIPLADPVTTSTGERMSHMSVQKGQHITWGIASYQRLGSRWGTNSHEFHPLTGSTIRYREKKPLAHTEIWVLTRAAQFTLEVLLMELLAAEESDEEPDDGAMSGSEDKYSP
ncbi:hypothetical protein B0H14DRAFT_3572647 [Mycena olivaceomarginata]|nr:hypothetical protein B0H14DRAFT_3572647 [Mycena olivaceomarginata]